MTVKQNFKIRTGIRILLTSGLVVLSILFVMLSTSSQAPAPAPNEIEISGFAFVPDTVSVTIGTTVTWTNQDSVPYTVTSETGLFDSGNLARNSSFNYSFADRDTFSYYCAIHPRMRGKVSVE